jgi:hypothetical protein
VINTETLSRQLREKVVELLVRIEHLDIFASTEGLAVFGTLCEGIGRCCQHLSAGRRDQAAQIAKTIGRSVPHAFEVGPQRDELEEALEEVIAVLEGPPSDRYH